MKDIKWIKFGVSEHKERELLKHARYLDFSVGEYLVDLHNKRKAQRRFARGG